MADPTTDGFRYLHRGREDIYGAIHGECVKASLGDELWSSHLYGGGSVGVYPLVKTQSGGPRVAWGCSDIDEGYEASLPLAKNLHKTLKLLGITSWVEIAKSRGYHVWVYVQGWCPADAMRNAFLFAHQVAGVTPTEVNPKSVLGGKGGNGNYVNLPYGGTEFGRRVVLDPATWLFLELPDFVDRSMASLNTVQDILKVAERYVPPPPPKRIDIEEYAGSVDKKLTDKLSGLAWAIFRDGPLEGRDRSGTLARLAHLMAESAADSGITPPEALALLADCDLRHGKFIESGRPEELDKMISAAWSKAGLI